MANRGLGSLTRIGWCRVGFILELFPLCASAAEPESSLVPLATSATPPSAMPEPSPAPPPSAVPEPSPAPPPSAMPEPSPAPPPSAVPDPSPTPSPSTISPSAAPHQQQPRPAKGATASRARDPLPRPKEATAPSEPQDEPIRHDGFFFQFRLGGGYYGLDWQFETEKLEEQSVLVSTSRSVNLAGSLLLGGTIAEGVVLGGGLGWMGMGEVETSPISTENGGGGEIDLDAFRYGGFVQYYPDPKGGLALEGSINYLALALTGQGLEKSVANGLGLGVGVGYGWWVHRRWSLGLMANATYLALQGEHERNLVYPELSMTLTYH